MKKLSITILIAFMVFVSGCGQGKNHKNIDFTVNYQYDSAEVEHDNSNVAMRQFGGSFLNLDFPTPEYDLLIPGDHLILETTGGSFVCDSANPSTCNLESGELISAKYSYTQTLKVSFEKNSDGVRIDNCVDYDKYVILDKSLHYIPLNQYTGEVLYGSIDNSRATCYCPKGVICDPCPLSLGGLFAFDPRPLK